MNIYEKMQNMRVDLQNMNIKKSGKNKFAGYSYYELSDILPPINNLQSKYKTCSCFNLNKDEATLSIINSENLEEKIEFRIPMSEVSLKAAHPIQNLGAISSYERRYLYMNAFEIVENDYFDAIQGKNQLSNKKKEELNKYIKIYSNKMNTSISDVVNMIDSKINCDIQKLDDIEADNVIYLLKESVKN